MRPWLREGGGLPLPNVGQNVTQHLEGRGWLAGWDEDVPVQVGQWREIRVAPKGDSPAPGSGDQSGAVQCQAPGSGDRPHADHQQAIGEAIDKPLCVREQLLAPDQTP